MDFEWDEEKRLEGINKHKVDMVYAALIFESAVFAAVDDRKDYGESRYRAIGKVGDEVFVVVYTPRGGCFRLISSWKGGRNDQREYEARLAVANSAAAGRG